MNLYLIIMGICFVLLLFVFIYVLKKRKTITFDALCHEAEKGDIKAQTVLGFMYHSGKGAEQNNEKAKYWLLRAAQSGSGEAQFMIAGLYLGGTLLDDGGEGVRWLIKSGESGFLPALSTLGNMYADGKLVERNINEAVKWFSLAAVAGDVISQKVLAGIYHFSVGLDRKKAYAWYTTAAGTGDKYAAEMAEKLFAEFNDQEKVEADVLAKNYLGTYLKR